MRRAGQIGPRLERLEAACRGASGSCPHLPPLVVEVCPDDPDYPLERIDGPRGDASLVCPRGCGRPRETIRVVYQDTPRPG